MNKKNKNFIKKQESITFDFDVEEGNISFSPNFKRIFGYELSGHLLDAVFQKRIIYDEDIDMFFTLPVREREYNEVNLRIKRYDGQHIWCKINIKTVFDKNKKPVRFVGEIKSAVIKSNYK